MTNICIALDAMGGDRGPAVIVPAALRVLASHANLRLILVGDRAQLESHLRAHNALSHPRLEIKEASRVIAMDEQPAIALRTPDSSMHVMARLVKEGVAQGCVSAGNTGALMVIGRFILKMLNGIDRPAITSLLPTMNGYVRILDLGANVDCTPQHLFQFAVMASVLSAAVDGHPEPTVGLLNIGTEAIKGSEAVKQADQLLSQCALLNYVGYVEGDDIYKGKVKVVVCDGFVGNVALKTSEGLARMAIEFAKEEFTRSIFSRLCALLCRPVLKRLNQRFDPSFYNGATMLGLRGIVVKSHGNADEHGFASAIRVAMMEVEKNVPERIQAQLGALLGNTERE